MSRNAEREELVRREELRPLDLWIKRSLKERYGRVAREPVPEDLLELLDGHAPEH
ncbi:MAG TPA: hypothetical protein VE650_19370 [Acetobacteraceae bacterium]|jgi:hypothetical protein|nr:hypothetical protein [Acetobacteraceae bacterium]